jgi:hypothetical protein
MRKKVILCSLFIMLLALSSCIGLIGFEKEVAKLVNDPDLVGAVWQLVSFGDTLGVGSEGLEVSFKSDGQVEGGAYPNGNRFNSKYTITNDRALSIASIWTTKAGLRPGSRYLEFLDALEVASAYEVINSKQLKIYYGDQRKTLIFKAAE